MFHVPSNDFIVLFIVYIQRTSVFNGVQIAAQGWATWLVRVASSVAAFPNPSHFGDPKYRKGCMY